MPKIIMDPDIIQTRMRELSFKMSADYEDPAGNGIDQDEANELTELVQYLDGWLTGGGALPAMWARAKAPESIRRGNPRTARTIGLNGLPSLGKRVRTAKQLTSRDYTQEAIARRRPDAEGTITGHSDAHGLCYRVRHDDGVEAYYDPGEITFLGVRSAESEE